MIESITTTVEQYSGWHLANTMVLLSLGVVIAAIGMLALAEKWQEWLKCGEYQFIILHLVLITGGWASVLYNLINI